MTRSIRRTVLSKLRRIPAVLCLLAVTMQVAAPVLHAGHEDGAVASIEAADGLHSSRCGHEDARSGHDEATCPQCRFVSQLKSLSRLSLLTDLPALRTDWIGSLPGSAGRSQVSRDSTAPRAPPLFV